MSGAFVAIGRVVKTQGLAGEVKVEPLTGDAGRFRSLEGCYVLSDDLGTAAELRRVEAVRFQQGAPIIKLAGADGIDAASALVGRLLAVREEAVRPLGPGVFYHWQLVGCRVTTEDGREVGLFSHVEEGQAQDLWVVRQGEREHLIPAVAEIIIKVDADAKAIVIRPPEGLLEL